MTDEKSQSGDSIFPKIDAESLRRNFFTDALRGVMGPVSDLFEKRVNPFLRVINDIPNEIDKLMEIEPVDQPHLSDEEVARRFGLKVLPTQVLRPPGAIPPGEFESLCSKCGHCVSVCPANAIKIDPNTRIAGGFPFIVPSDRPCVVCEELACMTECPTGALKLVEKLKIKMGTAKVDHKECLRTRGEDCKLCVNACPVAEQAIHISVGTGKIRVRKDGCIGCGLCENVCPTEPRAIQVRPVKKDDDVIIA